MEATVHQSIYNLENESKRSIDTQSRLLERDARTILPFAAFFIGDIRDGLPMVNLQGAFLICFKNFSKQQVSQIFLGFGIFQFLSMAPCGYFVDYTSSKIDYLIRASGFVSLLTMMIATFSKPNGDNLNFIIFISCIQGMLTPLVHPLLQSITMGIVGNTGFSEQLTKNRIMNHFGTALSVGSSTVIAYYVYPKLHYIFVVSPMVWLGLIYFLKKIQPRDIHIDAARSLIIQSPTLTEYEEMEMDKDDTSEIKEDDWNEIIEMLEIEGHTDDVTKVNTQNTKYIPPDVSTDTFVDKTNIESTTLQGTVDSPSAPYVDSNNGQSYLTKGPSFIFGCGINDEDLSDNVRNGSFENSNVEKKLSSTSIINLLRLQHQKQKRIYSYHANRALTPLKALLNFKLLVLSSVIFFFHVSNSSVLPLVMQSLSLGDNKEGILLSGLCIFVAQFVMMIFVKIIGTYSSSYGRTIFFLAGIFSLTIRCLLLSLLASSEEQVRSWSDSMRIKLFILCTQILDAAGAGTVGMLHILVTCDIAAATGRFALMLGFTNTAMCLGSVVSNYTATFISKKYGYPAAFQALGLISVIPLIIYYMLMPETLPDYERIQIQRKEKLKRYASKKLKNLQMIFQKMKRRNRNKSEHNIQYSSNNQSSFRNNNLHQYTSEEIKNDNLEQSSSFHDRTVKEKCLNQSKIRNNLEFELFDEIKQHDLSTSITKYVELT